MVRINVKLLVVIGFAMVLAGSLSGAWMYQRFFESPARLNYSEQAPPTFSRYTPDPALPATTDGFIKAAEAARPAVVHIRAKYAARNGSGGNSFFGNPFRDFFESPPGDMPEAAATGSGVVISSDGYIATNYHVIEDAKELEVTLFDNRSFKAKVIGTDPNTDLALIKIEARGLSALTFGNSDNVRVGEWVLAVGNPMDLLSTVTAGIVSAKGRNINLLRGDRNTDPGLTIESFIQTDAAVNRGNSGGALVNLSGELIGINTAIASRTGSYAGYSFAIPAALVKKVMEDLAQFGKVKRGFLGVRIQPVDAELAREKGLNILKGAYISGVSRESGAYAAGIRDGDVIVAVDEQPVESPSELQELVSRHRPGDKLNIRVVRKGEGKLFQVVLKGDSGNNLEQDQQEEDIEDYGMDFEENSFRELDDDEKAFLETSHGVLVESAGETLARAGIRDGFVITHVNGAKVNSVSELEALLKSGEKVTIKGLYEAGVTATFSFVW